MKNLLAAVRIWVNILAGLALAIATINLLVDPYDVFGTPRIAGISLLKPVARNHTLLAKTFQVARAHPRTVLIGSTTVHSGIDPSSHSWPANVGPIYNYGIPGSKDPQTDLRTLQEAVAAGGVQNAVVFIDFRGFLGAGNPDVNLPDDERRFRLLPDGASNPDSGGQRTQDVIRSVGTLRPLIDSLITVVLQRQSDALDLAPDGSGSEAVFVRTARSDGMFALFAHNDALQAKRAAQAAREMARWSGHLPGMDAVAAIVSFARSHDVKLTLVIAPHHADALELFWRAGLWLRVEQLKTELTTLSAAQGGTVTVWDFLDYSSFNTEPIPRNGDRRTPTSWFWDPTHFKKQLGDVMIQRMFGTDAPMFGIELTPANLAERNAGIRAERQAVVCEPQRALQISLEISPLDECCQDSTPHDTTSTTARLDVSR